MKYLLKLLIFCICTASFTNCKDNKTIETQKEKWVQLFNGENLDDWIIKIKGYPLNENVHNTFRVENGLLKVSYDGYDKFNAAYGHVFYKQPFSSYKLRLQYRFIGKQLSDGEGWATRNSGVMVHSQTPESMNLDQDFPVSVEVQLLGGLKEGESRPTANLCTPGTHVILNNELLTAHCISSSSDTFYGDQWVNLEVTVIKDSLIMHKVNGTEVLSYSKPVIGGEYNTLLERKGELLKSGYISLQSESHPVEFKNIEILELDFK